MNKDYQTEHVRSKMAIEVLDASETSRADAGSTTLSFQSKSHPNRHIWIDTDLAGETIVDLEDWDYGGTWDNSVAHLAAAEADTVIRIVQAWFSGCTVDECLAAGGKRTSLE
jgi:hypothetical protein